jgi:hypothetical protein
MQIVEAAVRRNEKGRIVKIRKTITLCLLSCLVANVTLSAQARSHQTGSPLGVEAASRRSTGYNSPAAAPQAAGLSAEQVDNLLAPVALYPDPLLAQVFPASTFVDQIDQAARWLRGNNNNSAGVDNQQWDVSVKSVAHYPQVVYMMSDKLDWTTALGQAYVNQSTDVLTSVQRLRARAKSAGHLASTPQQVVIVEQEVIKIVPAQPQVIYVPTYNPQVVYVQSSPSTGTVVAAAAITFGVGLAIGAWLNNDCNWHTHTVYYHGWHGTGWVSTSSHYVHVNSVYVNHSYSTVHVNSAVVHHNVNYNNINHYSNVNHNVNYNNVNVNNVNRNNVNVNNVNVNNVNRNNVNTNNVNTNNVNTNNVNHNNVASKNINSNDARVNSMRGHTNNAASGTANRAATGSAQQRSSAFGGFGSGSQTRAASQRGQASRASAQQTRSAGGGGRRRR